MKKLMLFSLALVLILTNLVSAADDKWARYIENVEFAEEDFFAAALLTAKDIENETERNVRIQENLRHYWIYSSGDRFDLLLDISLEKIAKIKNTENKVELLGLIADCYLRIDSENYQKPLAQLEAMEDILTASGLVELADIYKRTDQDEKARETLDKALTLSPDSTTVGDIGEIYAELGDYDKAAEVSKDAYSHFFNIKDIIHTAGLSGDIGAAWKLIDSFENEGDRLEGLVELASAYSERGELNQALNIFDELEVSNEAKKEIIRDIGWDYKPVDEFSVVQEIIHNRARKYRIPFIEGLIESYYRHDKKEELVLITKEYEEAVMAAGDPSIYFKLVYLYTELNLPVEAKGVIREFTQAIKEYPLNMDMMEYLMEMANTFMESEKFDLALTLLDSLRESAQIPDDFQTKLYYLGSMTIFYLDMGEIEKSRPLVQELEKMNDQIPDLEMKMQLGTELADFNIQMKNFQRAEELLSQAHEISKANPDFAGVDRVFQVVLNLGDYEKYQEIVSSLGYDKYKMSSALIELAKGYSWRGDHTRALEMLDKAGEMVVKTSYPYEKVQAEIGLEYYKMEKYDKGAEILNTVEDWQVLTSKVGDLLLLASHDKEKDYIQISLELAKRLNHSKARGKSLSMVGTHLLKNNQSEKALEVVNLINDPYRLSVILTEFGVYYVENDLKVGPEVQDSLLDILAERAGM